MEPQTTPNNLFNQDPPRRGSEKHPLANYQFSAEELATLRECNTESFFQRSLPLGLGFGLAAYFGVKRGTLTPNARYGAVPKVVVSVITGYFLGKFSYQRKCAEKIMKIPGSRLAELLKQRERGSLDDSLTPDHGLGAGLSLAPFTQPNTDLYSDEGLKKPYSSLDPDSDRPPSYSGLDDSPRPSLDSPVEKNPQPDAPKQKPKITYEELRRRNQSQTGGYSQQDEDDSSARARKNKYGDTWSQ